MRPRMAEHAVLVQNMAMVMDAVFSISGCDCAVDTVPWSLLRSLPNQLKAFPATCGRSASYLQADSYYGNLVL